MELKRRLSPKWIFAGIYALAFAVYIIIGLQPTEAKSYAVSTQLSIPAINLTTDVTELSTENGQLDTPDTIVGSYSRAANKTLLIGHASTVFENLNQTHLGDEITYNGQTYHVTKIETKLKSAIRMSRLLQPTDQDTLIIMTCAGELYEGGDASHRLLITATR